MKNGKAVKPITLGFDPKGIPYLSERSNNTHSFLQGEIPRLATAFDSAQSYVRSAKGSRDLTAADLRDQFPELQKVPPGLLESLIEAPNAKSARLFACESWAVITGRTAASIDRDTRKR